MDFEKQFVSMVRQEFTDLNNSFIWKKENGEYEVFDRYLIRPEGGYFRVFVHATDAGLFTSTRSALAYCIADKHAIYNLAREIRDVDNKLGHVINDVHVRALVGDRSKNPQFKEDIITKLESKVIRKKSLETQLSNCIKTTKYIQQKGFTKDETQRIGRATGGKTSR